jgi:lysine 6-dehydrogenase
MSNMMGLAALERLQADAATPRELRLWEGGLPLEPSSPWGYVASFNIEGLTNEYDGEAVFLRDGRATMVPTMTELEQVTFEGIGTLEAFVTSGGTSTLPYVLEGKLETFENKTCRYPGHFERFRAFRDLGLFSEQAVLIDGMRVKPRDLYHALLEPQIHADRVEDFCVIRARATGDKDGGRIAVTLDLVDRHHPETGFSAMERTTGGHAALMATLLARGAIPPGVRTLDKTLSALALVEEARAWGFAITENVEQEPGGRVT